MHYFIDESGQTGPNLFDENQPTLIYGVLGSNTNIDNIELPEFDLAKRKLGGVERIHANEIGFSGIIAILDELKSIRNKLDITFDFFYVHKPDFSLVSFFDQVFDQGLNPAVPWSSYWTPIRYVLLSKVAALFDYEMMKLSWEARIELNFEKSIEKLHIVFEKILSRIDYLPDERSRNIISDAIKWGLKNSEQLHYHCHSKLEINNITPNIIGFQYVMLGIANRASLGIDIESIVVDKQIQFNKSQKRLADYYKAARQKNAYHLGPGLPELDLSNIPNTELEFKNNKNSNGLQLVDIFLWITKNLFADKPIPNELYSFMESYLDTSFTDGLSLTGLQDKWLNWFENLPEPSEDDYYKVMEMIKNEEERRSKHTEGL